MLQELHDGASYLHFGTPAIEIYIMKNANENTECAALFHLFLYCMATFMQRNGAVTLMIKPVVLVLGRMVSWESTRILSGTTTCSLSPLPTTIIQLPCPSWIQSRNEGCRPSLRDTFRNLFEEANIRMQRRILTLFYAGTILAQLLNSCQLSLS